MGMRSVTAYVRRAPFTFGYLLVLLATTTVLAVSSERGRTVLLQTSSTNLNHLARDPVRVLVASALWLQGFSVVTWALLFVVVLAAVERALGTRRALALFAAGHVGATLLTALGLWIGIQAGAFSPRLDDAVDVGVSYGFVAVAAAFTFLLPRRARLPYTAVLMGYLVVRLVVGHTFTDAGHLVALAIGYGLWWTGFADPRRARSRTILEACPPALSRHHAHSSRMR
jgi:hypothetical protein